MAIVKNQIHELVFEKLKEMILSGEFKEGDYLLPEPELAKQLGTSRSALRGAMLLLRNMGVVEVTPGRGTVIKKVGFPSTVDPVLLDIHNSKDQILELLELRRGIEVEAAGLAAERANEEQINKLKCAYERMVENVRENNNVTQTDVNFHMVLTEISGNKLLNQVFESLVDLLEDTINKIRQDTLSKPDKSMIELESHRKILEAIEMRDTQKARKISAENLETVYNAVKSWQ
ncbi:MAG: FadR/GntR family transcriptional regulator [Desulfitobacteriaceae bacterium]|nr:FadR/GntR family transcriptional regulator [Clostridia bacterium]MDD4347300.1 FadR/GntR family transcriptional regulator [Desulfitobacteriaceae bacterium]MDD4679639.1 FadR/GntR family transcriptional regulator [Clostridia bacterium]